MNLLFGWSVLIGAAAAAQFYGWETNAMAAALLASVVGWVACWPRLTNAKTPNGDTIEVSTCAAWSGVKTDGTARSVGWSPRGTGWCFSYRAITERFLTVLPVLTMAWHSVPGAETAYLLWALAYAVFVIGGAARLRTAASRIAYTAAGQVLRAAPNGIRGRRWVRAEVYLSERQLDLMTGCLAAHVPSAAQDWPAWLVIGRAVLAIAALVVSVVQVYWDWDAHWGVHAAIWTIVIGSWWGQTREVLGYFGGVFLGWQHEKLDCLRLRLDRIASLEYRLRRLEETGAGEWSLKSAKRDLHYFTTFSGPHLVDLDVSSLFSDASARRPKQFIEDGRLICKIHIGNIHQLSWSPHAPEDVVELDLPISGFAHAEYISVFGDALRDALVQCSDGQTDASLN
jgi:hypothetical protein